MSVLMRPWGHQYYRVMKGTGLPVLFMNSLGTDLRMWDEVAGALSMPRVGLDKRGHGLSATPRADWTLDDLVDDAVALLDHLSLDRVLVAGCSIGGMIAQGLAAREPGRVAGLFLSNTALKVGTAAGWSDRIAAVEAYGLAGFAPQIIGRWFGAAFRDSAAALPWLTLLQHGDVAGYIGTCRLLAQADLRGSSSRIDCPVLMLAGTEDLSTPKDLVAETAAAIRGARVELIQGAGHIPAIDSPAITAGLLADFHRGLA